MQEVPGGKSVVKASASGTMQKESGNLLLVQPLSNLQSISAVHLSLFCNRQNTLFLLHHYSNANIPMALSTSFSIPSTAAPARSWKYFTSFSASSSFTARTPALDM